MMDSALFAEQAGLSYRTIALLGIVTGLVLIAIKRRYFSAISDIPGPFVASFSIWWQIRTVLKGHTELEMVKLHRKHGAFVRINSNEVSICHPDAIKQILLKPWTKGTWYTIFNLPDYTVVNQMSETDPKRHIQKNKNVMAGYSLSSIIKAEPHMDRMIELFQKRIDELIERDEQVELDWWFNYLAFDITGEVTFSKAFGFLEQGCDVRSAIANTRLISIYVGVMGHFVWLHNLTLGNPLVSRLGIQPTSHIVDTTIHALDERKNNPDVRKDMLQYWLDHRRQYPDRMEENEIFGASIVNVGAGADTTSSTMQGFIYYLLRAPKHMARLRQEIDTAHSEGKLSRIISYAEASQLPFLQACIKETYRVHSSAGTNLPRVVPKEGLPMDGKFFPEGTVVSINTWAYHYNPELFGEDCDQFNPERWLESDTRTSHMNHYLIHWSGGYNQCPGRHLAQVEISKVLAMMIRDYEIEQVDPKQEWKYETYFTMCPHDWPCKLKRRDLTALIH